jgi:hypothetical protein
MVPNLALLFICQEYLSKKIKQNISGFILNFNGKNLIITLHHFLPIEKVFQISQTEINQELKILINSSWNEFLILDSDNIIFDNYLIYKDIQNTLPKPNNELTMELKNGRCKMRVSDYKFLPYNNLDTQRLIPYIEANVISGSTDFAGLSGSPVFIKNKLVGVFSKAYSNNEKVLIIPSYVLIRSLEKDKDNNHIFEFPFDPKKINNYYVKENKIWHPSLKFKIPYLTYLLLEGNNNTIYTVQDSLGEISYQKMIIDTTLENVTEYNLIKLNQDTYMITPRLLSLLKRLFSQPIIQHILHLINKSEKNKDICLKYDKGCFIIVESN